METKTLYISKWLMALLTGNLTEEVSRKFGEAIADNDKDCSYALDKLLTIECKKVITGKESLESALATIQKEYEYLGFNTKYGNLNDILELFRFEFEALENTSDANQYIVACYNFYIDKGNEEMRIGAFYALLSYIVNKRLIENHMDMVQSINEYLSDKDNETIIHNIYYNVLQLIFAERVSRYIVIN